MSKTQTLKAEPRKRTGSGVLNQMRREGYVPSVIYGGGTENRNVKVSEKSFRDLLAHSVSENIVVNLEMEGGVNQTAFLKDVQHNALTGRVLHIDFLAIDEKTEITAQLPVEMVGEAPGEKAGGLLELQLHTVEVRCLSKDLPEQIVVQVDQLEVGDAVHIGEVAWPTGVIPTLGADVVVAVVAKTRVAMSEDGEEGEDGVVAETTEAPAEA